MKTLWIFLAPVLIAGTILIARSSLADGTPPTMPKMINFQGYLTNENGTPIPDQVRPITFRVWPDSLGGQPLWTGQDTVQIEDGLFHTTLDPINLPFDQRYWVSMQLQGEQEMERMPLNAVPYAIRAAVADSLAGGSAIGGSGTVNYFPIFNGAHSLTSSIMYQNLNSGLQIDQLPSHNGPRLWIAGRDRGIWALLEENNASFDGRAAIYASRDRTVVNNGAGVGHDQTNNAITGANRAPDAYTFGMAGYSAVDASTPGRSGGVLGASEDGAVWGSLGYYDEFHNLWGLYTPNALYCTQFRMSNGGHEGYVLTSNDTGTGTWRPATGGTVGPGTPNTIAKFTGTNTIGDSPIQVSDDNIQIESTAHGDLSNKVYIHSFNDNRPLSVGLEETDALRDGRQGIYAVRYRQPNAPANPGTGRGLGLSNNAIVGVDTYADAYTFAIHGLAANADHDAGAIIGEIDDQSGSKWAGLGYKDGQSIMWGMFTPDNVYVGGRIGIGTNVPAYSLDVLGDIRTSGTVYGTVSNADKVDNFHAGNAAGQAAVSNGTLCATLNADKVDGYETGNAAGQVPVSNGTLSTNLNADKLDGYHAGNASGQVPLSNGTVCTNLNADKIDGVEGSSIMQVRSQGGVNPGSHLDLTIPHYLSFTLELAMYAGGEGGVTTIHGFENDSWVILTYQTYNGDGTGGSGGAEGSMAGTSTLVSGGHSGQTYTVACMGTVDILRLSANNLPLQYRLVY